MRQRGPDSKVSDVLHEVRAELYHLFFTGSQTLDGKMHANERGRTGRVKRHTSTSQVKKPGDTI